VSPSPVAFAALLLLAPLTAVAFSMLRPAVAASTVWLFAVLFLPEKVAIDAPAIPPLDKNSIAAICVLVAGLVSAPGKLRSARPGTGFDWLAIVAMVGAFVTVLTNPEPLFYGRTHLPGLALYDAVSVVGRLILTVVVPFFVGRAMHRSADDARDLLRVLVIFTLIYTPFVLYEVRMSPQLHRIVYGFAQHSFAQTVRDGGYRPMCFMGHGLALAMFVFTGATAAWALAVARVRVLNLGGGTLALLITGLMAILRSLGALVYTVVLAPLTRFAPFWVQRFIIYALCAVIVTYPFMRATGTFPTDLLLENATSHSADRAQSLGFRFENEDLLLARAQLKPWFGWGGYGRSRVFDEYGNDISVTDGAWIIVLGDGGAVGLVSIFGLLLFPALVATRTARRLKARKDRALLLGLTWIVVVTTVDLLPNGLFSSLNHYLAGCLAGLAVGMRKPARPRAPA
jgi:hypothetical protein